MFEDLKCISNNVNLDDYYELYNNVRKNMEHPEWLGVIPIDETKRILLNGGKIWLYYKDNEKDNTPKTGINEAPTIISLLLSMLSLVGIIIFKKF